MKSPSAFKLKGEKGTRGTRAPVRPGGGAAWGWNFLGLSIHWAARHQVSLTSHGTRFKVGKLWNLSSGELERIFDSLEKLLTL